MSEPDLLDDAWSGGFRAGRSRANEELRAENERLRSALAEVEALRELVRLLPGPDCDSTWSGSRCRLGVAHAGPHTAGGSSWTDDESNDAIKPSPWTPELLDLWREVTADA